MTYLSSQISSILCDVMSVIWTLHSRLPLSINPKINCYLNYNYVHDILKSPNSSLWKIWSNFLGNGLIKFSFKGEHVFYFFLNGYVYLKLNSRSDKSIMDRCKNKLPQKLRWLLITPLFLKATNEQQISKFNWDKRKEKTILKLKDKEFWIFSAPVFRVGNQ